MMRTTFFLMCTILVVTACSATGERKPRQPSLDEMLGQVTEQNGRACIRINDIDGYAPLSDDMVSVSARGKKHYLVTTMFRCYSLGSSFGVAFSGAYSEVCGRGQGELITREEKCPIMHIYEFPSRDDAFASLQAAESRREAQALFPDKVEP
jgi:hypothetical protein